MKKGCLIALGGGLLLVAVILLLVFWLTRDAVRVANQFLGLLSQGKIEVAYQDTSATLRSQQSLESFATTVKGLGLTDYASVFWSNRETKNDRAHLEGSVTTRAGGKIPLTIELVKEAGSWKITYLSAPRSGVVTEPSGKPLPTDEKSKALVLDSLLAFNEAVQAKSFVAFHEQISRAWQEQISAERLQAAFADFIDKQIDISSIKALEPILTEPPQIDGNGILILPGYYPTHPARVYFRLKYVYEHPAWKLLGIDVKVKK